MVNIYKWTNSLSLYSLHMKFLLPLQHPEYLEGMLPTDSVRLIRVEQVEMLDGKLAFEYQTYIESEI